LGSFRAEAAAGNIFIPKKFELANVTGFAETISRLGTTNALDLGGFTGAEAHRDAASLSFGTVCGHQRGGDGAA
jgi:hypothetical protein